MRAFPDGREAVFLGKVETNETQHLYAIDITTGKARRLAPDLPIAPTGESFPITPTPENRSVLIDTRAGDLHRIVSVPRIGAGTPQTVMTLSAQCWYMDAGKDGSIYLDQVDRPHEILRFSPQGGTPEVIAHSDTWIETEEDYTELVEALDGRFLLDTLLSERERLLIGKPGADFLPLLDTSEETTGPATSLGNGEVAFLVGSGAERVLAVASTTEGRILRRLESTKGKTISGLAGSMDGKTLYYVSEGSVWAIPASDGTPQLINAGDKVAVDANGRDLIVTLNERSNARLVRVSASGGPPREIPTDKRLPIAPVPLGSHAVAQDGKILIPVSPRDAWFFRLAILNPITGHATMIPTNYTSDTIIGNWTRDGRIACIGLPLKGHVWRFRPAGE